MKIECCVCLTDLPDQCKTASYAPVRLYKVVNKNNKMWDIIPYMEGPEIWCLEEHDQLKMD